MELSEYQAVSARTLSENTPLSYLTIKLAGETGEVCELIGKSLRRGNELDLCEVEEELGDVLWYLAAIATHLGLNLEGVAEWNIKKLEGRHNANDPGYF